MFSCVQPERRTRCVEISWKQQETRHQFMMTTVLYVDGTVNYENRAKSHTYTIVRECTRCSRYARGSTEAIQEIIKDPPLARSSSGAGALRTASI